MPHAVTYGPVVKFELTSVGPMLAGYASPKRGDPPCLLTLTADDRPIMHACATRHSASAQAAGFRSGWCGFEIPGVAQAFAIGDRVALKCGVSGEVLAEVPLSADLLDGAEVSTETLSVNQLLLLAQRDQTCDDVTLLQPFALAHLRRHGPKVFVEAAYQTFLKRWPDAGADFELEGETEDEKVENYLNKMVGSEEYAGKWRGVFPGPFYPSFRFDRDLLR